MHLRPYQIQQVDRVRQSMRTNRRVIMRLATGGGKTPTGAYIAQSAAAKGKRVYWLAHKDFLMEQASDKLKRFGVRHGILASGRFPDPRHNVLVCSLGVLRNRWQSLPMPDLVVTDECHHCVSPTWEAMLSHYGEAYHLGLTATPERPDGLGLGDLYDDLVCGYSEAELMAWNRAHPSEGLCPYRIVTADSSVVTEGVRKTKGDYVLSELGEFMAEKAVMGDIVSEPRKYGVGSGRKFLTFSPTVKFSENVAEAYRSSGLRVIHLDGTSGKQTIRDALRDYSAGQLDGITSVNLFLEGLDISGVGMVQWLRNTESDIVFKQGNGRGWRPDTDDVIFMDHVHNFGRFEGPVWVPKHGLPDAEREWSLDGRKKAFREKPQALWECQRCHTANSSAYTICKSCGTPKQIKQRKDVEIDASVAMGEIDVDQIRTMARRDQASARGVDDMMAKLGYSKGRAEHIEAARKEKAFQRAKVREVAMQRGDVAALREYMKWKPKELSRYLESDV